MTKLVLLGAGGHCESVIEVIESIDQYKIHGILDPTFSEIEEKKVSGYNIIGNDDKIIELISEGFEFVITVGQIKTAQIRKKLYQFVKTHGGKLPVIKASTAYVSKYSKVGEGTVLMHFSMINNNVKIGICNIINNYTSVEHGCAIGDFNHISTRATVNGDVVVQNEVFIGSGVIINQGYSISNKSIIGSGAVVRHNIQENETWVGNPAKRVK